MNKPYQCPLYPRKQIWIGRAVMSALCHKRTYAISFDHIVGDGQKRKAEY